MTFWGIVGAVSTALGIFYGGCVILFSLFAFVAKQIENRNSEKESDDENRE